MEEWFAECDLWLRTNIGSVVWPVFWLGGLGWDVVLWVMVKIAVLKSGFGLTPMGFQYLLFCFIIHFS